MATVDKNFKVKHGLVVEGNTATVNGSDVITANAIAGGTQNNITVSYDANSKTLNFSVDALAIDTQGPLTYNNGTLDLATGQGLGIGGNGELLVDTNTVANLIAGTGLYPAGGGEIAVSDQFVIDTIEAANALTLNTSGNLNTSGSVSASNIDASTAISVAGNTVVLNGNGVTVFGKELASKEYVDGQVPDNTDGLTEGSTNLYFTTSRAVTANEGLWDASGSAANALTSAQSYTDSRINDGVTSNVKTWSSTKINSEISTAVSGLVDGAPELLNTLNELAAAIADNPNYATDVANLVGTKQDSFTAGNALSFDVVANTSVLNVNVDNLGISVNQDDQIKVNAGYGITVDTQGVNVDLQSIAGFGLTVGSLGLMVDANLLTGSGLTQDVLGGFAVDTNTIASVSYVDTNFVNVADLPGQLDDYVPLTQKGANDGVATLDSTGDVPASQLGNQFITDVTDNLYMAGKTLRMYSDPSFTDVKLQTYAKLMSNTNDLTVAGGQEELFNMYTGEYDSAEIVIKARKSDWSDRHMTKILVTCDGSGNVAITEYGSISTNQDLFTVEATGESWGPNHVVRIKVTPLASINVKWYAEQIGA